MICSFFTLKTMLYRALVSTSSRIPFEILLPD